MKRLHSGFIFLFLVLVAALLSIFICIGFTHLLLLSKKASDFLLNVLFFVIYGLLLFIWIHVDNNWWK